MASTDQLALERSTKSRGSKSQSSETVRGKANKQMNEVCRKLLANLVHEEYRFKWEGVQYGLLPLYIVHRGL